MKDCVYHESFPSPSTEEDLFGPASKEINVRTWSRASETNEETALSCAGPAVLQTDQQTLLFLRYNYARYRLSRLAEKQRQRRSRTRNREMNAWRERATRIRADLVHANLALVPAMAKRMNVPDVEFEEMISEGNMALLRSVDKFDVSRGFKFSTYACRAILTSFSFLARKARRYRKYFPAQYSPEMEQGDHLAYTHEVGWHDSVNAVLEILSKNRAGLTALERTVVLERFGLQSRGKGRTLSKIAKTVGLSTERVRQILDQALAKIRIALERCGFAA